jgi:L-serine dehydratase
MIEYIGVLDMLKIGVGPSSSHTLGPWRAAQLFLNYLKQTDALDKITALNLHLYGSLSLTGKGHATDMALLLGLEGYPVEHIDTTKIPAILQRIKTEKTLKLEGAPVLPFDADKDIIFHTAFLPFHSNGLRFEAILSNNQTIAQTYYSIGGGFVVQENQTQDTGAKIEVPYPINSGQDLLDYVKKTGKNLAEIVYANETALQSPQDFEEKLWQIWQTMLACVYQGCHAEGILPGGLQVKRRAFDLHAKLLKNETYTDINTWQEAIKRNSPDFQEIFTWISTFALAVNEVNAALGRVVTAPTNGSAGVIPAVLMYYVSFVNKTASKKDILDFLMVASVVGSLFKRHATISAAAGGCQAEIGVSSAMAAAGLAFVKGASAERCLMAAEIAMEHHLGMTCDPVAGLVQIPCIERNSMGAVKAINAAELAILTDPHKALVPLDKVIAVMWQTAKDMSSKYKETSQGGLAVEISVNQVNC